MTTATRKANATAAKELRRRLQWTQVAEAKFLGVEPGTVSRWERGVVAMPSVVRRLLLLELGRRRPTIPGKR